MKKLASTVAVLLCLVPAKAQDVTEILGTIINTVAEVASSTEANQQKLSNWGIPAGNYSGITTLGDGRYAVVSDKGTADGFFIWKIAQDPETGLVTSVENEGFFANTVEASADRDCEGIIYFPKNNTVFISGEGDQRVLEYDMDGQRTGNELEIPDQFKAASGNQGLEALAFGGRRRARFYTTSESTLPSDGTAAGPKAPGARNMLRIQSFRSNDFTPSRQYAYQMDAGMTSGFGSTYVFGVPELCALPNGQLLVLEREANVPKRYLGATVSCKIYAVKPRRNNKIQSDTTLTSLDEKAFLEKTLVADWTTQLSLSNLDWANYEGMCLGDKLADGRQTLLLVSDSQGGYGKGPIRLQDFIKVIVLE